jgi:4-amino-4-deoxy-L-arabinose transferase-like glycosyltransferase
LQKINIILFAIIFVVLTTATFLFPKDAPDTSRYMQQAVNLAEKSFYSLDGITPSVKDSPGLPVVFAIFIKLGINPLSGARVFNALLLSLMAVVAAAGMEKIFSVGKLKKTIIAIIIAFYPTLAGSCLFALTEIPYAVFLFFSICLLLVASIKEEHKHKFLLLAIAGVLLGIANLFRPVALFLSVAILFGSIIYNLLNKISAMKAVKEFAIVSLFMLLALSPWIIRNYIVFEKFIPGRAEAGAALFVGSMVDWKGEFQDNRHPTTLLDKEKYKTDLEQDNALMEMAIENIKKNPVGWIKLMPLKFKRLMFDVPGEKQVIKSKAIIVIIKIITVSVFLLAIAGVVLHRNKIFVWLMATPVIYTIFIHLVLFAMPRFRVPVDPFLILLAACCFIGRGR